MTGTYLHNTQRDEIGYHLGLLRGYEEGDSLEKISTIEINEVQIVEHAPEVMFVKFNRGSGDEVEFTGPSMSVGDVAVIVDRDFHEAYKCASFGFERVTWEPRFAEFLNEFAVR